MTIALPKGDRYLSAIGSFLDGVIDRVDVYASPRPRTCEAPAEGSPILSWPQRGRFNQETTAVVLADGRPTHWRAIGYDGQCHAQGSAEELALFGFWKKGQSRTLPAGWFRVTGP